MTVTIGSDDLIQPFGELSNALFPQSDLDDQIDGWLYVAVATIEADANIDSANHDLAAAAYVYSRAYDYIANQIAALPGRVSEGDGAVEVSYNVTQFRYYRELAAGKLAQYQALRSATFSATAFFTVAQGQRGR